MNHNESFTLYYNTPILAYYKDNSTFRDEFRFQSVFTGENQQRAYTKNRLMSYIKILPHTYQRSKFRIYTVTAHSFFGKADRVSAKWIKDNAQLEDLKILQTESNYIDFEVIGNKPSLYLPKKITIKNFGIEYIVPAVFAFFMMLLIFGSNVSSMPAFADISSHSDKYQSLNGLRGLAAIFVLLEHTMVDFIGFGGLGVWIFFALSGFLLAMPFAKKSKSLDVTTLSNYMLRRIKRIMPMYFVIIFISFIMYNSVTVGIRHLMFLQADGYLWTIPQEMYFYVILPMILCLFYYLLKDKTTAIVISLCIFILLSAFFINNSWIYIYSLETKMKLYLEVFMMGVLSSYLYFRVLIANQKIMQFVDHHSIWISIFTLGLFFILCYLSLNDFRVKTMPLFYAISCSSLLVLLLINQHGFMHRFFSFKPLVAVGVVGYSFYLLHPKVIAILQTLINELLASKAFPSSLIFVISLILTYLLSVFTYSYIEKPFMLKK